MAWKLGDGGEDTSRGVKGPGDIGGGRFGNHPLYSNQTTQHYPLGYRWDTGDGRVFRYASFLGAVTNGHLASQDNTSQFISETSLNAAVRNSAGTAADIASSSTVTRMYFLDSSLFTAANSDDVLAGGFLHIVNSATGGNTYKIKSNAYAAATSVMTVDLYDSLVNNITSESEVSITGSMYKNLAAASTTDQAPSGLAFVTAAATSFGWLQTWGPATVKCVETTTFGPITQGAIAVLSDTTAGCVETLGGGHAFSDFDANSHAGFLLTNPVVGYFMDDIAETVNYTSVYLQLAP